MTVNIFIDFFCSCSLLPLSNSFQEYHGDCGFAYLKTFLSLLLWGMWGKFLVLLSSICILYIFLNVNSSNFYTRIMLCWKILTGVSMVIYILTWWSGISWAGHNGSACNSSPCEMESRGSRVQGQFQQHRKLEVSLCLKEVKQNKVQQVFWASVSLEACEDS